MSTTMFRNRMVMTMFLAVLTFASAWAGTNPKSCLDYCGGHVGNIIVEGWTYDPDAPAVSNEVHVYVYRNEGCTDLYTAVSIGLANYERPDVNETFNITGNHGFYANIPIADAGPYFVKVFAIDATGDNNPLMNRPFTEVHVSTHEGTGTMSDPYIISSLDDWNLFAELTSQQYTCRFYGACSYKMTADIGSPEAPVTQMFGNTKFPYSGIFYGYGNTLYVNIATDEAAAAPFRFVNGATIWNLVVEGTVAVNTEENNNHAGGLVGICRGGTTEVLNCVVGTNVEAYRYAGGIVGHGGSTGLVIRNSIYKGTISGFKVCAGGLVGWCDWLSMELSNCLMKGSFQPGVNGFYHPIALTNNTWKASATCEDVYYKYTLAPTATTNLVPGAAAVAVSETPVGGKFTTPVVAVDGQTWYAPGTDGCVSFSDNAKHKGYWTISPQNPIVEGTPVTLTYYGPTKLVNVSAIKQQADDTSTQAPFALTPQSENSWTFTMPHQNVVVNYYFNGDVNNDYSTNEADIAAVINVMAGKSPGYAGYADVNGDAKVDVADMVSVVNAIVNADNTPDDVVAVDLGLPSGTMWASMNVGAQTPEDYGLMFAWGETTGYSSDTSDGHAFNWVSYMLKNSGQVSWTQINKYQVNDGKTQGCWYNRNGQFIGDGKTTLEPVDDAAYANWGEKWVIPTYDDVYELLTNTTFTDATVNGINGHLFTSKTNGNSIFLPAAGCQQDNTLNDHNQKGYYWSSSVDPSLTYAAQFLYIETGGVGIGQASRCFGFSVRPVLKR